jgi:hypothetical protein
VAKGGRFAALAKAQFMVPEKGTRTAAAVRGAE